MAQSSSSRLVTADLRFSKRAAAVKAWIERNPGAIPELFAARRGAAPIAVIYKVMGKIFAILSFRPIENVILKCDSHLATMLRRQYAGVGHRSHLDRRYWISVTLDADVPSKEVKRLVSQSYALICAKLTEKQKAALARWPAGDGP
jgi:predicted DNA-binding protein (MmcQ/YjbR family)